MGAVMGEETLRRYREPPKDITYVQKTEIANCAYCMWRDRPRVLETPMAWRCLHPKQRYSRPNTVEDDLQKAPITKEEADALTERPSHRGRCITWNYRGDCTRYTPSRWTRFLRFFGFRPPAWEES